MKALSVLILFSVLFIPQLANAQAASSYIKQCGIPEDYDLELYGDFDICNYYMRQLQYKENADKFSRQLRKRRELFAAPRNILYRQYKDALDAMHYGEDGRVEMVGDALEEFPQGIQ